MKVPMCYDCHCPTGLEVRMIKDKPTYVCRYCDQKGTTVHEERLDEFGNLPTSDPMKVLGDFNSASSYAIRSFTSPLGRIKMSMSTNSNFCHSITVDGVASKSLKRFIDEDFTTMEAVLSEYPEQVTQAVQTATKVEVIAVALQLCVNNVVELDLG